MISRCAAVAAAAGIAGLGVSTASQAAAFRPRDRLPALIDTIAVGDSPNGIAVSPVTGEIYTANYGDSTISVTSPRTGTVIKTIPVGDIPEGVAVSPVTGEVYVTNSDDNTLSVIG